jgi:hypothetical protein
MSPPIDGLEALRAARPLLRRVACARDLAALDGRWLLHAGPPFDDPARLPPPVLASAVLACRYEGWASTDAQAERLIATGAVRLLSAQSVGCVTPLAAVVSPSTAVAVVEDAQAVAKPVFAPLGTTGGPDLRFGTRDPAILDRLRRRDRVEAPLLASALSAPLDLLDIAGRALAAGDDLHNRTTAATQALAAVLAARWGDPAAGAAASFLRALGAAPLYFLTLWMAAAKLMLAAAEGRAPSTLVTALAGNGCAFGLQLAGAPGRWISAPATAPAGPRLAQAPGDRPPLGAIGDSAVIDALGFGGHALAHAQEPRTALRDFLPEGFADVPRAVLSTSHPAFEDAGLRVGLDARRVVDGGLAPIVTLGMVDAAGEHGLLGRGVYRPPLALFREALRSLDTNRPGQA